MTIQIAVALREARPVAPVVVDAQRLGVGDHGALGAARGARGEDDVGGVVRRDGVRPGADRRGRDPSPAARKSFQVRKSLGGVVGEHDHVAQVGQSGQRPAPGPSPAARRSEATYEVPRKVPVTNSSLARVRRRTYAASVPLKRVLSGTRTPPARHRAERGDDPARRVLGAQMATRSPARSPAAAAAAAARSTRAPSSA